MVLVRSRQGCRILHLALLRTCLNYLAQFRLLPNCTKHPCCRASLNHRLPCRIVDAEALLDVDQGPGIPGEAAVNRKGLMAGAEEGSRLAAALCPAPHPKSREPCEEQQHEQTAAGRQRHKVCAAAGRRTHVRSRRVAAIGLRLLQAAKLSNSRSPSVPPTSGSIRFSGCGIRPSTFSLGENTPAMLRSEPFGLPWPPVLPSASQ